MISKARRDDLAEFFRQDQHDGHDVDGLKGYLMIISHRERRGRGDFFLDMMNMMLRITLGRRDVHADVLDMINMMDMMPAGLVGMPDDYLTQRHRENGDFS